jgi:hypothetical protein
MPEKLPTPDPAEAVHCGAEAASHATISASADGLIDWQTDYTDIDEAREAAERLAEERG